MANKTKNRKIIMNERAFFTVSAVLGVLLLGVRVYQMLAITDYETGFFTEPKNFTVTVFYVLFVLFVAFTAVLSAFSETRMRSAFSPKPDPFLAGAGLFLSVGLAASCKTLIGSLIDNVNASHMTVSAYIKANKAYSEVIAPVFAVLSVVVVFAVAVGALTGKPLAGKLRLMLLCPAMFMFTVCVKYFGITASYLKEPQFMLLIFATAFFMLFMFEFARYISGIAAENSKCIYTASGVISIVLFAALLIPSLAAKLFRPGYEGVSNADFMLWQAAAPVFALAALMNRRREIPDKQENAEARENEETQDSAEAQENN